MVLLSSALASAEPTPAVAVAAWWKANFHAHAASADVHDDGSEAPSVLHAVLKARGFDVSVHSPHSTMNTGPDAARAFMAQQKAEAAVGGLLGQELTVATGPNFRDRIYILGKKAPGNLDHLSLVGHKTMVPSSSTVKKACSLVHAEGGVCLVNHPGPGPMMWEEGLWEKDAASVDGLEVYNGQVMAGVGFDFEGRYLDATAYRGLHAKLAAVTGADTHGPNTVERARSRLPKEGLGKLVRILAGTQPPRAELQAATWFRAATAKEVIAAVRARHTVATWALADALADDVSVGDVHKTGEVSMQIHFKRKLHEVTLYKEGVAQKTWNDVDSASWTETVTTPTAYVFGARDGAGRLLTSATWYEP